MVCRVRALACVIPAGRSPRRPTPQAGKAAGRRERRRTAGRSPLRPTQQAGKAAGRRGSESTGPVCQSSARSWPAALRGCPSHRLSPAGLGLAAHQAGRRRADPLPPVMTVVRPHSSGPDRGIASWWLLGHACAGLLSTGDSWRLLRCGLRGRFPLLVLSHYRHYCQCSLGTLVVFSQCC